MDNGSGSDATNLDMGLHGNARIGAKVKVSDELKGRFKYGATSASRKSMLRLEFGGVQIAAIEPEVDALGGSATEVKIPKLKASYTAAFDVRTLKAVEGYNTYDIDSISVNSYVVGLGAKTTFGPAYLAGSFFLGQNLGTYGFKTATDADPVNGKSTFRRLS